MVASGMQSVARDVYWLGGTGNDTIILCGWMDGQLKHIAKYADGYRMLYPTASILVLLHRQAHFFLQHGALKRSVRAGLELVPQSTLTDGLSLHVHVFSNGGCFTLTKIMDAIRPIVLKPRQVIFDSCPGIPTLRSNIMSFTMITRWRVVKVMIAVVVLMTLGIYKALALCLGLRDLPTRMREQLNSELFMDRSVPRLYLYSIADKLIDYRSVEAHMADAAARGYDVESKRWDDSEHVSHMRVHPVEYWETIQKFNLDRHAPKN